MITIHLVTKIMGDFLWFIGHRLVSSASSEWTATQVKVKQSQKLQGMFDEYL